MNKYYNNTRKGIISVFADATLYLKGEFYSRKTHKDPPFESRAFTMPEQPDHMLSVGLSEFTVNSASFGYFSAGLLQALINDSMVGSPEITKWHKDRHMGKKKDYSSLVWGLQLVDNNNSVVKMLFHYLRYLRPPPFT